MPASYKENSQERIKKLIPAIRNQKMKLFHKLVRGLHFVGKLSMFNISALGFYFFGEANTFSSSKTHSNFTHNNPLSIM
jgi:hypothetical protein